MFRSGLLGCQFSTLSASSGVPYGPPTQEASLTPPFALGENTKRGDWVDRGEHQARQKYFWIFSFNDIIQFIFYFPANHSK
jgi:hypothetical protein